MRAHFIVSEGVTAKMASIIPAPSPAAFSNISEHDIRTFVNSNVAHPKDFEVLRLSPGKDKQRNSNTVLTFHSPVNPPTCF